MRVIIQRVKSSHVSVDGEVVGKIGQGLNLLVGISDTDTDTELDWMAKKCLELRLFPGVEDGSGAGGGRQRFDRSVQDINGELLVISQFTLYGDCRKGRRPSFDRAATRCSEPRLIGALRWRQSSKSSRPRQRRRV